MTKDLITKIIAFGMAAIFSLEVSGYDVKIRTKYDGIFHQKMKQDALELERARRPILITPNISCFPVKKVKIRAASNLANVKSVRKAKNNKKNIRDYKSIGKIDFMKSPNKKHKKRHSKSRKTKLNLAKASQKIQSDKSNDCK